MVKPAPKSPRTPKTPKTQSSPKISKTPKRKEPNQESTSDQKDSLENTPKRPKQQQPNLTNFFKPLEKPTPPLTLPQCMPNASRFRSLFQLKQGWEIAPILKRQPLTEEEREQFLEADQEDTDYLKQCKSHKKIRKTSSNSNELKAKYFHFHDNYRPPYYGTWRRRSSIITGRRPFSKEEKSLNYDYDSDDDWEEEPADADECKSDEEEDEPEKDAEESDEENDGFFVDHGYLSTDEGSQGDYEEIDEDLSSEQKKLKKLPLNEKNEELMEEEEKAEEESAKAENEAYKENEQRRCRLEQKAEEFKAERRRKERLFKKRQLIPTVYLPSEGTHPVYDRFVLQGIIFDYSTIVIKDAANAAVDDSTAQISSTA